MQTTHTSSFFNQVDKIKRELIIGMIVIFIGALGYVIYHHLEGRKEYKAAADYFMITQTWKNKEKPLENLKEEANRTTLEEYIEKHKNTSTALSAAVMLADHYSSENNEAKALELLEKNAVNAPSTFVQILYVFRRSVSLERVGKCDKAIPELDKLIAAKTSEFIQPDARLQKALCLEQVGKKEEAKAEYENISKNFPETEAGKDAKKYLRLLDIGA